MTKKKRVTIGKIAHDLLLKTPESRDPIELQREMQKEYLDHLIQCVEEYKNNNGESFYIKVITKNEKLMPNVFRNYFMAVKSCPTPDYDQTIFYYNRDLERIEYIWTIPSKDACIHLKKNALQIHPDERSLLQFVLDFADGTLFKRAKKLNGEQEDSPLLEKGN